ncbi:DUF1674 domain-containing protein [Parvularcula mediterranea]|nr:DUF1674 domain-containing protein [Parvularcula mediterranea]
MSENDAPQTETEEPVPTTEDGIPLYANGRKLSDMEIEILREAKARRDAIDARADVPKEIDGGDRKSEPTRYGDWEKAGRAYDFS